VTPRSASGYGVAIVASLASLAATSCGASGATANANYDYVPAAYDTVTRSLSLFPATGTQEVQVQLPAALGGYRLTSNGTLIYTTSFRLDLRSMKIEEVPGLSSYRAFASMSVSTGQQNLIVAGKRLDGGGLACGIFLQNLQDGGVRQVVGTNNCDDVMSFSDISLSPDGKFAVAIHGHSLEVIDLVRGTVNKLGSGYDKAGWSPDGRWIAAAKASLLRARMVLFDGRSFAEQKTLASSVVLGILWSPDSRFLLGRRSTSDCGEDQYTYESFDVETAQASLIESSRCKVDWRDNDVGWVEKTIGRPRE